MRGYPRGVLCGCAPGGYLVDWKGLSLMTAQEKFRRVIESSTTRSIAKCIALCTLSQIAGGRRPIKADKGKSCCS